MKKLINIFFVFTLLLFWCGSSLAQDATEFGLAPVLPGGGTGKHAIINPEITTTAYGNNAIASPINFLSMPIPAGTPFTIINSNFTPGWLAGADMDAGGQYYGCTYIGSGSSNLVSVNKTTGVPTVLGAITGFTLFPTSLAFNNANSTWYFGSTDGTVSYLYTLNITTRVATLVGTITNCTGLIALAIDCGGNAYGVDISGDNLVSINLTTGAGTIIGPLGFNASFAQDADFDPADGTLYLAAYNATTSEGQLRTANLATGNTTLVFNWGGTVEITGFAIEGSCCAQGPPSNPNPPSGATNIPLTGNVLSWTNSSGVVSVEVYFQGSMVYTGAPITSFSLAPYEPLAYGTTYSWRVVCKSATCGTSGPTWTFTTIPDPNLVTVTVDLYPQNVNYWTGTCNASTKTQVSLVHGENQEVGWMTFNTSPIVNDPTTVILGVVFHGYLYANSWPYWAITPMGSVNPVTAPASAIHSQIVNNYSQGTAYGYYQEPGSLPNDWVIRNLTEGNIYAHLKNSLANGWFAIGIVDFDFSSSWYVRFQGWNEQNKPYLKVTYQYVIPVELVSFTANASEGMVELNWITASETNNQGFEVQRSNGGEFEAIAFVNGYGTTTETQAYSFVDRDVNAGTYSYRLKQVDFDGTFEYSNIVEVEVPAPNTFALEQNYPNPFNPSTKISFRLAVDSKVSLKVFDVLGQEVATLVNTNMSAGSHSVDFDASGINSGVYLYRIEATGIDGTNYTNVKKMMLTK